MMNQLYQWDNESNKEEGAKCLLKKAVIIGSF